MKAIRITITTILVMLFTACANDTQIVQTPEPDNAPISEAVIYEPENTPTPEPVVTEPENTPTPEPVVTEPESTPPPELVVTEPENTPVPKSVISEPNPVPIPNVSHADGDLTRIQTRDEFYQMIIAVNEAHETGGFHASSDIGERDFNRLTGLTWYYDFVNLVEDVVLREISIRSNYVAIDYQGRTGTEPGTMVIQVARTDNVDVNLFIAGRRRSYPNAEDIFINGSPALKTSGSFNQYHWVQDGHAIFLRVPSWLLVDYPEETFFDIQKIDVQ